MNLRQIDTATVELPEPQPKPTSRSGQLESAISVWADDATDVGVWECDAGEFTADRSTAMEVCHIISGSGTVTGEDGTSADIGPGSLLVLPKGWRGTWLVKEPIRKTYVMIGS
ncbi:putative cupin superfamily protein [Mycobacterium frederiksbergense]|uniref:Cupin superfamily protein n=1 Tax=Mycolicibacterium frederiksbergense TaxID=117567 RepID=A0ABT6L1R3_9MYCO|nr:cupin domain-containing protein [Mycolicibacterium frederiksbergense]MDH6196887.1 putative cupin superfamily protein [Mycolicibacterium frederiksbergense]